MQQICDDKDLILIEDCAQAHGAEFDGKKVGGFGVGCFSFYPTKNMTTGEGGMITTNDDSIAARLRLLRNHGDTGKYNHVMLGYNYRMMNIQAAIGLVQLGRLEEFTSKRIGNAEFLNRNIGLKGLTTPHKASNVRHVYHQYVVRVEDDFPASREKLMDFLQEKGIASAVHYPKPIYDQPLYREMGDWPEMPHGRGSISKGAQPARASIAKAGRPGVHRCHAKQLRGLNMDVGVIGVGSMGRNHVRVYSELKGVENVYVFDPVAENAEKAKDFATICSSMEDLLGKVEAVSICVPTKYHFDVARKAINAGISCLIEKPITLTVEEGEELLKLLRASGVMAGVGHIERFNPIVEEIKKIAERPDYVSIKRHNPTSNRITDASVVEDLMIHDIDIVFNVLFKGDEDYKIYSAGTRNVCEAMVVFKDSVVAISASRMSSKKFRTFYVEAEDFTTEGDFMAQEVFVYRKPDKYRLENERYTQENIIEKVLVNKVEPLKVELKTFMDCARSGKSFPVTPEEALKNLVICEEIKKGIR